ncbi:MAG: CRISPR-associated helicase Cas3' [Endomicrobium sp.]|uniref:CRISPR-associated helicase Cas3' n=1 Tax=Candidatus Endomicrobiellum pyrsonymphae TaxID=1408203 RepID=UPI003586C389|nr:CRISPR-associated helicase Cas3' [Endomicrobium sp.]
MVSENQAPLFYARLSKDDKKRKQELKTHLTEVAEISQRNASKIGMGYVGYCLGLLHDLGKYSKLYQDYLLKKRNDIRRGDIDHSTAGAQYFDKFIKVLIQDNKLKDFLSELIELCCVSHHSGLIDMIDIRGKNKFNERLSKEHYLSREHYYNKEKETVSIEDVKKNIEKDIADKINNAANNNLLSEIEQIKNKIDKTSENKKIYTTFSYGMIARFLLSCLIDGDHTNSADFERGTKIKNKPVNWNIVSEKLEKEINRLNDENKSSENIKEIRKQISDDCARAGQTRRKGCYKLEVPTGGGKTLASFRFAVEMAKRHGADRIIYCIPFTTIIEQNASTIRKIVETDKSDKGKMVLEHHSNISQTSNDTEELNQTELYMQSWDVPIIFTTNVQILEIMFGRKPTNTRKFHQLANSIIIFDEVQALPIKCVHLFNNAINYLVDFCNTTVVLCTATQPLLDKVCQERGCLKLSEESNIVQNRNCMFDSLKRVEIKPEIKDVAYTSEEIASKAIEFVNDNENCLVICNTTKSAKEIFEIVKNKGDYEVYHLSARMMPVHRKVVLRKIKRKLNRKEKIVVVSTQVIEAGIDIDFNCGIRALAGLDSIIQAAGRINRNGTLKTDDGSNKKGELYVYNFNENLGKLEYIEKGRKTAKIILRRYPNADLLDNKIIKYYYADFFYQKDQQKKMQYLICDGNCDGNTELDLLSENRNNYKDDDKCGHLTLKQSFKAASNNFKVIDDIASPVCIEINRVLEIIKEIKRSSDFRERYKLIKKLHKYSVNIYPNQFENLRASKINEDLDIYSISDCYYDKNFGITEEATLDKGGICV